jgi:callose synthase
MILHLQLFVYDSRKALQVESKRDSNSVIFILYVIVIGIYAGVQLFISFLELIPACHLLMNRCDHWPLIRFVKWLQRQVFVSSFAFLFL